MRSSSHKEYLSFEEALQELATMDIDEVYGVIGELGSHQRKLLAVLILPSIYTAFHMIHMVFIGSQPTFFFCEQGKTKITKIRDHCPTNIGNDVCDSYSYDGMGFTSVATEWDLVCDDAYKIGMAQSLFMFGVLTGALVFGSLSDWYGRKKSFIATSFFMTLFSFLAAFSQSLNMFLALRVIAGVFCGGLILTSFVLIMELIGSSMRTLVGLGLPVCFAIGIMMFAGLASMIHDWRVLSVVVALPGLLPVIGSIILPESPRWLLSKGRLTEAENVLEMIAKGNQTSFKGIQLRPPDTPKGQRYGLIDLMRYPVLRNITIIQAYGWLVSSAVYYGLTMSAGNLGANPYISVTLSAVVELPAYVGAYAALSRFGRRWTYCGSLILGGAVCLAILMTPAEYTDIVTMFALCGKLAISSAFAVVYIYSAELFPTVIRNNAMGVVSMAARLGGIIAPMIVEMRGVHPNMDFMVFGGMAFSAGVISLRLPETANCPMPETMEDLERKDKMRVTPLSEDKVKLLESDILQHEKDQLVDQEIT